MSDAYTVKLIFIKGSNKCSKGREGGREGIVGLAECCELRR